jgi:hypothetical protein
MVFFHQSIHPDSWAKAISQLASHLASHLTSHLASHSPRNLIRKLPKSFFLLEFLFAFYVFYKHISMYSYKHAMFTYVFVFAIVSLEGQF